MVFFQSQPLASHNLPSSQHQVSQPQSPQSHCFIHKHHPKSEHSSSPSLTPKWCEESLWMVLMCCDTTTPNSGANTKVMENGVVVDTLGLVSMVLLVVPTCCGNPFVCGWWWWDVCHCWMPHIVLWFVPSPFPSMWCVLPCCDHVSFCVSTMTPNDVHKHKTWWCLCWLMSVHPLLPPHPLGVFVNHHWHCVWLCVVCCGSSMDPIPIHSNVVCFLCGMTVVVFHSHGQHLSMCAPSCVVSCLTTSDSVWCLWMNVSAFHS